MSAYVIEMRLEFPVEADSKAELESMKQALCELVPTGWHPRFMTVAAWLFDDVKGPILPAAETTSVMSRGGTRRAGKPQLQ